MYSVVPNARQRARSKRRPLDLTISSPNNFENPVSQAVDARFQKKFKFSREFEKLTDLHTFLKDQTNRWLFIPICPELPPF